jgi:hypothetical protein
MSELTRFCRIRGSAEIATTPGPVHGVGSVVPYWRRKRPPGTDRVTVSVEATLVGGAVRQGPRRRRWTPVDLAASLVRHNDSRRLQDLANPLSRKSNRGSDERQGLAGVVSPCNFGVSMSLAVADPERVLPSEILGFIENAPNLTRCDDVNSSNTATHGVSAHGPRPELPSTCMWGRPRRELFLRDRDG